MRARNQALCVSRAVRRLLLVFGSAASLASASSGLAEPLDPTLPLTLPMGEPLGRHPMPGVDAGRTRVTTLPLPFSAKVSSKHRLPGGVSQPAAVDSDGNAVFASLLPEVTELAPSGKPRWTIRLGDSPAASAPVITSDGLRVVVTEDGSLIGIDPGGRERYRTRLPVRIPARIPALLPTRHASVVLAVKKRAFEIDFRGQVSASTELSEPIAAIVGQGDRTLLVDEAGSVFSWHPPLPPRQQGRFGGQVKFGAALRGSRLLSVVDHRVVSLSLSDGQRSALLDDRLLQPGSPLALLPGGGFGFVSLDGLLMRFDRTGKEIRRRLLDKSVASRPGESAQASTVRLLADETGRFVVALPGAVALVNEDGAVHITGARCAHTASLSAVAPGRFLVACRSGMIWQVSGSVNKP